ncbi:MAG TPA: response regulator [Polyangiales bacterium]|nr:response regulator [Polyangiales bacterium]
MNGASDQSLEEIEAELVSVEERARILSAARLKLTLAVFMAAILLGLSALMFSGVDRIFSWLTPSIRNDLQHKALHGALELAQSAQLGLVTADVHAISDAVAEYEHDSDVTGLLVTTQEDAQVLYSKSHMETRMFATLLGRDKGKVHDLGAHYGTWMTSEIEGAPVGSVAVLISKARLDAGEQLRREVLRLAAIGCFVALVASLVFVSMYIGPILRVTSQTFERLERTTEAALASARLKSQFLANMSHEIRTPMNGIIGVLDLLNRTPLTAKQQRYTQTIDSSARSLLTIINDILDFSKLEAGKYEVRQDDFEVTQLVQDATELLSPKAHAKGLDLVVRTASDVPEVVRSDSDRLKQVIINLLGNAIKFTEQGHIELRVSIDEATPEYLILRFAIVDTGVGIRPEDQDRLFGVFSQVDGSLTRKYGGTGLGLAISRRIAEAMGGQCGVESELGKGSTFWFTAKVGHASSKPSRRNRDSHVEARILVASSSEVQRAALSELVQRWGMRVETASTSAEACERLINQEAPFNLVVMDGGLKAGESEGLDLGDLCLAEDLPVIRLLATTEVAAQAAQTSQAFLWKPVRASELYNSIMAISTGKEIVQRLQEQEKAYAEAVSGGQGRVLVVDDNEVNRLVACEQLGELGYESDTACNGQEAFEKVRDNHYDVVLMDCQMPGVDGFQATTMIRELPGAKARVPIIALTAHAMVDDRDRVLRGGMDDYATKPIRGRVLSSLLIRWMPRADSAPGEAPAPAPQPEAAAATPHAVTGASTELLLDETLPRSRRVVELFLQTVPQLVADLATAVQANDPLKVKQLAHKLKGNCLSLGANRMAAVCHDVELAALAGNIDHAAHSCIAPELAAVTPLLTQVLENQAKNDTQAASA